MNLNFNTTVHLSAKDCEDIIQEYLRKEKGLEIETIQFEIVKELCGLGTNEHECSNFKGATIRCNPVTK